MQIIIYIIGNIECKVFSGTSISIQNVAYDESKNHSLIWICLNAVSVA